jgi:hypothetical protein
MLLASSVRFRRGAVVPMAETLLDEWLLVAEPGPMASGSRRPRTDVDASSPGTTAYKPKVAGRGSIISSHEAEVNKNRMVVTRDTCAAPL